MSRQSGWVLGAALLMGAGCAHNEGMAQQDNQPTTQPGAPSASTNTPAAPGSEVTQEKDSLEQQADGTAPGKIRDFTGDTLVVDSQGQGAPITMTLKMDTSVPVFQGTQKVGTDVLAPGQDVRVYYKNPTEGTQPQAIAVEVVNNGAGMGNDVMGNPNSQNGNPGPSTTADQGTSGAATPPAAANQNSAPGTIDNSNSDQGNQNAPDDNAPPDDNDD